MSDGVSLKNVVDELATARAARVLLRRVAKLYKEEIEQWCGHDLACELVAQKTGMSEADVRRIVCNQEIW